MAAEKRDIFKFYTGPADKLRLKLMKKVEGKPFLSLAGFRKAEDISMGNENIQNDQNKDFLRTRKTFRRVINRAP